MNILEDFKVTSVWAVKHASEKSEWEEQLNCYAYLAVTNGYLVDALRIVAICRDWQKKDAAKYADDGYPAHQVAVIPIRMWSRDKQRAFLEERVAVHMRARDVALPLCTPEERWERYNARAKRTISTRCESYCAVSRWCSQAIDAKRAEGA